MYGYRLFYGFLLLASFALAQELPESGSRRIEPVKKESNSNTGSILFPKSNTPSTVYKRPNSKPVLNMRRETDLSDPGIKFKNQKFKQDRAMAPGFVSDTFLGELRTGENILRLVCRDHQYVDGDLVRIWVDDKVVVEKIYLRSAFQGVNIPLAQGFNKVEVEALNQGSSGPNTAHFKVMDLKGNVVQDRVWNLSAGVKALLVIIKE
ncbi:MAG: hypothetical protein WBA16_07820 [Nonlabens sp.]